MVSCPPLLSSPSPLTPETEPIRLRGAAGILQSCQDEEILLEGRTGTGKSIGACYKLLWCACAYPGSRHLLCRETRRSMTDSILVTLESLIGDNHPEVTRCNRDQRHSYRLWGSEIVCAGMDEPSKVYGTGWDLIYLNEGIESALDAWELFGRGARDPKYRRSQSKRRMPYHQRICDLNPGAPPFWANQRATSCPDSLRKVVTLPDWQRLQDYNRGPQDGKMRRLVSVHQDNPTWFDFKTWAWLAEGEKQRGIILRSMSGHRLSRMFHGLWKSAEGSVYPNFSDEPKTGNLWPSFNPPADWPLLFGTDPGFDHPWANLWFTVAPTGELIVCAELIVSGQSAAEVVAGVKDMERKKGWQDREITRYGDPQYSFSSTAMSKKTIAEQWGELGLILHPWPRTGDNMDGMVGAVRVRVDGRTLILLDNCPKTIAAVQSWSFKRNADGTPGGAKGKDAYEEEYKDPNDVIRGIVALNPRFTEAKCMVYE
jgi:hypothetical protein